MKIIGSVAISMDGYLDDLSPKRLILSNDEDFEEVRELRAKCDAILVGAETIRKDNPSLITYSKKLIKIRKDRGQFEDPIKITITNIGNLNTKFNFFQKGNCPKIVITSNLVEKKKINKLAQVSKVIQLPQSNITAKKIIQLLEKEGIKSLFIEGGSSILSLFLMENSIHEFRLAIAPLLVGENTAPRLIKNGKYNFYKNKRMNLMYVKKLGDMAVLYYNLKG